MHKSKWKNAIIVILSFLLLCPYFAFAQIEITEIMADPEGSDDNREWIKILNSSSETIDLTDWKFYENETNHRLSGDLILEPNQTAIIADNIDNYKLDYPEYSGPLIDSSFSLKNTGEYLAIKDADGNIVFEIDYSSEEKPEEQAEEKKEEIGISSFPKPKPKPKPKPVANAGPDIITTDLTIYFDGSESKNATNFFWNFGDGQTSDEMSPTHTYKFPGEYLITLKTGDSTDSLIVVIYSKNLKINEFHPHENWIELYSQEIINLSGWQINDFVFPENSLIMSNQYLTIPINIQNPIQLIYPNGETVQEISFDTIEYAIALNNDSYVYTELPTPGTPNFVISKSEFLISNQISSAKTQEPNKKQISNLKPESIKTQLPTTNSELPTFPEIKTEPILLTASIGLLVNKLVIPFALILLLGMIIGYVLKKLS